jgi:hypothetical protein
MDFQPLKFIAELYHKNDICDPDKEIVLSGIN